MTQMRDTEEIRKLVLAARCSSTATTESTILILAHAVEALCDLLDNHQHSYYGSERDSRGMGGRWLNTGPSVRDDSGHAAYMKAHEAKYKAS